MGFLLSVIVAGNVFVGVFSHYVGNRGWAALNFACAAFLSCRLVVIS